jgi:hypothetical protein
LARFLGASLAIVQSGIAGNVVSIGFPANETGEEVRQRISSPASNASRFSSLRCERGDDAVVSSRLQQTFLG